MKPNSDQESEGRIQIIGEDTENAFIDYEDTAEATSTGKYRCRDCGKLFDTLEEHDLHHRQIHGQAETVPLSGMPM